MPARGGRRTAVAAIGPAMDVPRSARATRAARAAETWQQLIPNEPGVEDLLEGKRVPLAAIDSNPDQPRKDVLRGIEELASSIEAYGLLQPIVVNPPIGGRYTCIAGHRRLAAYRYLFEHHAEPERWATIPAIERDTATEDRMVLALLENLSRQDLTDAEIITGLRVLHDLRGWHQAEIARRLGVSRAWITQYFRVAADSTVSEHVQTRR
ncbi:MAG TPA: ParB/RepB/Spo0J family partition protein, partial [Chloroflexota bacterium]|nr:ParB/RepB/Spo0J family partition protein [Chloroflexota bacterium]